MERNNRDRYDSRMYDNRYLRGGRNASKGIGGRWHLATKVRSPEQKMRDRGR